MKRKKRAQREPVHPCAGCAYARHGYICYDRDGGCLRIDMREIAQRQQGKVESK